MDQIKYRCGRLTDGVSNPEYQISHHVIPREKSYGFRVVADDVMTKDQDGNFRINNMIFLHVTNEKLIDHFKTAMVKVVVPGPEINYCPICGKKLKKEP